MPGPPALSYRPSGGGVSIVSPHVEPQSGHTYRYLSPCGSTNSKRLRTFTARLHFGHASKVASIRSNDGLRFSGIQLVPKLKQRADSRQASRAHAPRLDP